MRVTESLRYDLINRRLAKSQSDYVKTVIQASTGQRINAPSDDPIAAAEASRIRSGLNRVEGYKKSITLVRGDVELAESVLAQVGDMLQRASEIATSGSNGSASAEYRKTLALETRQLREQITGIANTQGARGYLFSGTASNSPAMTSENGFVGNDGKQLVDLGTGEATAVNLSGKRAFAADDGVNVIDTLDALVTALDSNDTEAVRGTLNAVSASHAQVQQERSRAGNILNRLDVSSALLEQTGLNLAKSKSEVVDIDAAETFSRLTQLQAHITNSIAVSRQLLSLSSLDRF